MRRPTSIKARWKSFLGISFGLLYTTLNIIMGSHSFTSWLARRDHVPTADKIIPIITQAGSTGMTRGAIGSVLDLDRDVLDQLLAGLVGAGLLVVTLENGVRVYRGVLENVRYIPTIDR